MFHCSNLERQHFVSEVFAELEKSCTLSIGSDTIGKGNRTSENQGSLGKTLGFKDVLLEFIWCPPDVVVLEAQSHLGGVPGIFCGSPRFTLILFTLLSALGTSLSACSTLKVSFALWIPALGLANGSPCR